MKTIKNAMGILALFADHDGPLGVNDIALRLGYEKSYVSRVLAAMRDLDFLAQDHETRKYTVGLEAFALGARYIADTHLTRTALPIMRETSLDTGESIFLTLRRGTLCRHILAVEGQHFLEIRSRLGLRMPLHASASGKALLAFAPTEQQQELLDGMTLTQYTKRTITTNEALVAEIARIQAKGLSSSREELVVGLAGWAAPIFGEKGELIAALSIVMPESVAASKDESEITHILRTAARKLSLRCGARVYPY